MNVRPRPSQSRALIPLSYRSSDFFDGERAALTATSAVARPTAETLAEAAGVEPAHAKRGDLANRCHTVRRRLQLVNWRKGQDLNLQATECAVVFGTTALPVRLPFQEEFRIANCGFRICSLLLAICRSRCWQGRSDLNRESRFWRPMVCQLAYIPKESWCMW